MNVHGMTVGQLLQAVKEMEQDIEEIEKSINKLRDGPVRGFDPKDVYKDERFTVKLLLKEWEDRTTKLNRILKTQIEEPPEVGWQ